LSQVLIISATTNNNFKLAQSIAENCKLQDVDTKVLSLEELNWPLYTPTTQDSARPSNLDEIVEEFKSAKAFIYVAPEYNGGVPPIVSNTIAWVSVAGDKDWRSAFNGTISLVATHSGGPGTKYFSSMKTQLEHLGCIVLPRYISASAHKEPNPKSVETLIGQLKKLMNA
jgi:chromate reductase